MTDDVPAWSRVYADLRGSIDSGHLKIDDVLPSVAVLRERHGVGGATVQRALDELRVLGMISEPRKGAKVRVVSAVPHDPVSDLRGRLAALEQRVERLERGDA